MTSMQCDFIDIKMVQCTCGHRDGHVFSTISFKFGNLSFKMRIASTLLPSFLTQSTL